MVCQCVKVAVCQDATSDTVKSELQDELGIPTDQQRLILETGSGAEVGRTST